MSIAITVVTKRVTASAHVRYAVTANVREPAKAVALNVAARRGPSGPKGVQGDPGTIGEIDPIIFNGGNF